MINTPSPKHVFMSYSRRDEAVMQRVVGFLREQGINVWVDNEKLVPGTPIWEVEIEKAIINAGAVVVLLSPDSKNSPWVRREIGYAEDNGVHIFPILIVGNERNAIPIRLTNYQRIDIRQREEIGLQSLSAVLSVQLNTLETKNQGNKGEAFKSDELTEAVIIDSTDLRKLIKQVAFSSSADESRPILQGVFIDVESTNLKLASADGFRLSVTEFQLDHQIKLPISAIIPAQDMTKLAKLLASYTGLVSIRFSKDKKTAIFQYDDSEFYSKLIEGSFPDISSIIPSSYWTQAICETSVILTACRQAELSESSGINIAKLKLVSSNDTNTPLELEFITFDQKSLISTIAGATVNGVTQEIAISNRFLQDALEVIDSKNLVIEATKPNKPVVFRPHNGNKYLHIIMPMQFS